MKLSEKKGENNRTGAYGEKLVARWLRRRFYRIIGRNVEMYCGELDIIASRVDNIVFCEVKTRKGTPGSATSLRPLVSVTREKRLHIARAAKEYLQKNPTKKRPRIDVFEVYLDPDNKRKHRIIQIKNAFGDETR